jgi:hypothetical protein
MSHGLALYFKMLVLQYSPSSKSSPARLNISSTLPSSKVFGSESLEYQSQLTTPAPETLMPRTHMRARKCLGANEVPVLFLGGGRRHSVLVFAVSFRHTCRGCCIGCRSRKAFNRQAVIKIVYRSPPLGFDSDRVRGPM